MQVELDKKDIIHLIRGVSLSYDKMSIIENMGLGHYKGGFQDKWDWNYTTHTCWNRYSEKELFELYRKITKI